MADIAAVFHWSLEALSALPVPELMAWQRRAADRWNRMNGTDGANR